MEVELHPSTSNEIRDRVVGKVSHVRLKPHQCNRDGQSEASHKKSVLTSCFRGQAEHSDDTNAALLLTVESCEVRSQCSHAGLAIGNCVYEPFYFISHWMKAL